MCSFLPMQLSLPTEKEMLTTNAEIIIKYSDSENILELLKIYLVIDQQVYVEL